VTDVEPLIVHPPVIDELRMIEVWDDVPAVSLALNAAIGVTLPDPLGAVAFGDGAILWWEGDQWLWRTSRHEVEARGPDVETTLDSAGILADISGGFQRIRITGPLWRELLMIESWFNAGDLAVGAVAGALLHHTSVRIHGLSDREADIYAPASLSDWLFDGLRHDAARLRMDTND
jgi:heterotetrameric sarcosine oxidase gamma subunit